MTERQRHFALRAGFLALLAGGLILWARLRMPKDVSLIIDLTESRPGDLQEIDVLVMRGGNLLFRSDRHYKGDAPQKLRIDLRAPQGEAEVDASLIYPAARVKRISLKVNLSEGEPATVK